MLAMMVRTPGAGRVDAVDAPRPQPGRGEVLIEISACGVCRTDLHVVDGEVPPARVPMIPGHEIVGRVVDLGPEVTSVARGTRVGVGWLAGACGVCTYCTSGRENLCADASFTGCHRDGGFAAYATADARFVLPLPDAYDDEHAAPLLCAGLIGYRAYRLAGLAPRLGIYGFGAAGHLIAQVARHDGRRVFAFTSPGDSSAMAFARELGAVWAGGSDETPPEPLDAALLFAPVGALVPAALANTVPGGTVVCAGIHMSDIPAFPYRLLWKERTIRSVANLTREDGRAFLAHAASAVIRTETRAYPLSRANEALDDLRAGRLNGAAVLRVTSADRG